MVKYWLFGKWVPAKSKVAWVCHRAVENVGGGSRVGSESEMLQLTLTVLDGSAS